MVNLRIRVRILHFRMRKRLHSKGVILENRTPGKSSNFTDDYPLSWSHRPYHPPTDAYKDAPVCKDPIKKNLQTNLICPVRVKDQPEKSLPDLQSLNYAIDILKHRRNSSKPLFLAVGFHKPHIPLKFPRRYLKQVPLHDVEGPKFPDMPKDLPLVAWHPWTDVRQRDDIKRLNISFPFGTMPRRWTLKIRRNYYAAAKYIDDLVGKLISNTDLNNTIVIFTSDHGWSLGENGLWAKYSNFEVALKVPLIFLVPGKSHQSITAPVELVDLFPTIIDLADLSHKIPKCKRMDKSVLCFEGRSLVPLMKSNFYDQSTYSFALSQYPRPGDYPTLNSDKPHLKDIKIMGYSIRTKRYRYTEWISFNNTIFSRNWNKIYGIELYDHLIDPYESHNLISDSSYRTITNYLSALLRAQIDITFT